MSHPMTRIPLLAAALALLAHAAPARAEKIGYVDVQRAVSEVDEGKAAVAKLRQEFEPKLAKQQETIQAKQDEFNKALADFEKQKGVLSEAAAKERQEDLARRYRELRTADVALQQEMEERRRGVMQGILDRMELVIGDVAEANGFAVVLERQAVLHAPQASDLTTEVIRKYNTRFKGAPPATAKAPAAGKAPATAGKPAPAAA